MSTGDVPTTGTRGGSGLRLDDTGSTETKAAFKTTELLAYLGMLAGLFIAGAVTGGDGDDSLIADQVWLYATLLTIGYMLARGLAKSGSRDPYSRDDR